MRGTGSAEPQARGQYRGDKKEEDKVVFKLPSLVKEGQGWFV